MIVRLRKSVVGRTMLRWTRWSDVHRSRAVAMSDVVFDEPEMLTGESMSK